MPLPTDQNRRGRWKGDRPGGTRHRDPPQMRMVRQRRHLIDFGLLPAMAIEQECRSRVFLPWRITRLAMMRRIYLGYQAGKPLSTASRAMGQLSWTILEDLVRNGGWSAVWNDAETLRLYPRPSISPPAPASAARNMSP